MNILEKLEKILATEIAVNLEKKPIAPDEDLLEKGIIDSLGIMKLILFMQDNLCIEVDDEEIVPENFQNLNNMVKFVEKKIKNK